MNAKGRPYLGSFFAAFPPSAYTFKALYVDYFHMIAEYPTKLFPGAINHLSDLAVVHRTEVMWIPRQEGIKF
jgi:hypothetical protein